MDDNVIKHLEFTQNIISRMAQNSFLVKGWVITLVSALFALSAKEADASYVLVAYFPALFFWLLDGYFLYQERMFRNIYDDIRTQKSTDFSFVRNDPNTGTSDWAKAIFSKTLLLFHGVILLTLLFIMFYIEKH